MRDVIRLRHTLGCAAITFLPRLIADWLSRIALLAALCSIGWEFHGFREDMTEQIDPQTTAAAEPDVVQDRLDAIQDDIEKLEPRVDAILVAVVHAR